MGDMKQLLNPKGDSQRYSVTMGNNRRWSNSSILKVTARDSQQLWETTRDMEQLSRFIVYDELHEDIEI